MPDVTVPDDSMPDSEVALLTRLLSDSNLRRRFRENAEEVARQLTDEPLLVSFLMSLDHPQLEAQAATLIMKRQHEVAQLLPMTWRLLSKSAPTLFQAYTEESPWPEGHARHLLDAEAFGLWLVTGSHVEPVATEWNRLRFLVSGRRAAIRIARDPATRYRLQILFRGSGGRVRELIF